jgi:hypothetical protein
MLPLYQQKMGPFLRDLIKRIKDAGITRANARTYNVGKGFSIEDMFVDSLGRIHIEAQFRNIPTGTLNQWLRWGVVVGSVTYPEGKLNPELIAKLKLLGATFETLKMHTINIPCGVPFDVVEEFAKDTALLAMASLFPRPIHDGGVGASANTFSAPDKSRKVKPDTIYLQEPASGKPKTQGERLQDMWAKEYLEDESLPGYMRKIDRGQRAKIREMENSKIPATDTTKRLMQVQIWLRGLDKPALDSILAAKTIIGRYICDTRSGCDESVVQSLRALGVKVDQYPVVGEIYAQVPFDSVASVAKVSKVFQITGMPHMRTVEGW